MVESDNRQGTGAPPRQWWKGRLPAPLGHERRVASLAATLHSTSSQPFPLLSRFSLTRVLACSLGSRAAFVSPNDVLTILSSGHSGEIGALAMVMWQGQSCAVTGSMDGTVRTQFIAKAKLPASGSHTILRFDCGTCASEKSLPLLSCLHPSDVFIAAPTS